MRIVRLMPSWQWKLRPPPPWTKLIEAMFQSTCLGCPIQWLAPNFVLAVLAAVQSFGLRRRSPTSNLLWRNNLRHEMKPCWNHDANSMPNQCGLMSQQRWWPQHQNLLFLSAWTAWRTGDRTWEAADSCAGDFTRFYEYIDIHRWTSRLSSN